MKNKIIISIVIALLIIGGLGYFLNNNTKLFSGRIETVKQAEGPDLAFARRKLTIENNLKSVKIIAHLKNTGVTINDKLAELKLYINDIEEKSSTIFIPTSTTISNIIDKNKLSKCQTVKIKAVLDPKNQLIETDENNNTAELELFLLEDETVAEGESNC